MSNETSVNTPGVLLLLAGLSIVILWATGGLSNILTGLLGVALAVSGGALLTILIIGLVAVLAIRSFTSVNIGSIISSAIPGLRKNSDEDISNRMTRNTTDSPSTGPFNNPNNISDRTNYNDMAGRQRPGMEQVLEQAEQIEQEEEKEAQEEVQRESQESQQTQKLNELIEKEAQRQTEIAKDIKQILGPLNKLHNMLEQGASVADIVNWAHEHQETFAKMNNDIEEIRRDFNQIEDIEQQKKQLIEKLLQEEQADLEQLQHQEHLQKKFEDLKKILDEDLGLESGYLT